MPDPIKKTEEKKPLAQAFGEKIGSGYLVGGSAQLPIGKKTNLSLGYNKVLGSEQAGSDKSINLSKETKKGGTVSLGYNSNKQANASYTTPKGNRFSARYNPMGGAIVSARINLGKKKKN
jgi:hypothetical protein